MSTFRFAVSATFTAEPLEPILNFWSRYLDLNAEVAFASYNQVAQVLLDPAGLFAQNHQGVNVILVRLEDLAQFDRHDPDTLRRIESNLRVLLDVVRAAPARLHVPLIFVICPSSSGFLADHARARFAREMVKLTESALDETPGLQCLTSDEIERLYPVLEKDSPEGERLANIPYSDLYFCAVATAIVRLTHGLHMPPFKVIALDCDNTLWRGICGEDGPRGVAMESPYRVLQEFMLDQRESGMLLTMASKNNERDVLETFEQNPDMPLQPRHFITWRLNWESKAANLEALATELSLGADTFILVDDNPKETAEVSEELPQVLSLTLPQDPSAIPHFLSHVWAFDHVMVTEEDRQRNVYYAQSQEFGRELQKAQTPEHFLATLELRVEAGPLVFDQLARVAQLTQRTNQFNFTGIRRSEQEIWSLVATARMECRTIEVSDRFGAYGLTGVVLFAVKDDALVIDTFLLSCRVLGRGVEHRVMNLLAEEAQQRGLRWVIAHFTPTAKNQPARDFLNSIDTGFGSQSSPDRVYKFPADLRWQPKLSVTRPAPKYASARPSTHKRPDYQTIAMKLSTAAQIYEAMIDRPQKTMACPTAFPTAGVEARLAQIWCDLLKVPSVPLNGNFFDLGGHSLLAVALIMRVKETFNIELPIDDVYAAGLTLGDLARRIEALQQGAPEEYDAILRELESLSDEEVERLLAEASE